jgi:hypothetical protein
LAIFAHLAALKLSLVIFEQTVAAEHEFSMTSSKIVLPVPGKDLTIPKN